MAITIKQLVPALVDDYFLFFDQIAFADHPEWGCECYCCFFHASSEATWQARTAAENQAEARAMIMAGTLQGLLAYDEDKPVAWCHYDRQQNLPGLAVFYPQLLGGDPEAGAIVCFTVAQGYRGRGIASQLLAAACADLAGQGYQAVEAYPLSNSTSVEENYPGPKSMYLAQGFAVLQETDGHLVVRKNLLNQEQTSSAHKYS